METPVGTVTVDGAGQTGSTIAVKSDSTSDDSVEIYKAGDYIQFGTTNQLCLVTEDFSLDTSERGVVSIKPQLRTPPADGETVISVNVRVPMILRVDEVAWDADAFGKFSFRFAGIEVFE